jgi:hypothetical protein
MKTQLRFTAFLGVIAVVAVGWIKMPAPTAPTVVTKTPAHNVQIVLGDGLSRTQISHLVCPVNQAQFWRHGWEGLVLTCRVVDTLEAKLVNAGYCYSQFAGYEGRLGPEFWQQCQATSTLPHAAEDGTICFGGVCSPAPGYPLPPWGHENVPCVNENSLTHVTTSYDSDNPRFALGCAAGMTMVMQARQDRYEKRLR